MQAASTLDAPRGTCIRPARLAFLLRADPGSALDTYRVACDSGCGCRHALFVSGDDTAAKAGLQSVLEANNFAVIDLGDLATGSRIQQTGGPLGGLDLRLSAAG